MPLNLNLIDYHSKSDLDWKSSSALKRMAGSDGESRVFSFTFICCLFY
jgi:hypothetical protein